GASSLAGAGRRNGQTPLAPHDGIGERSLARLVALRQGLISNLTNPAAALFFLSLLPQFSPRAEFAFAHALRMGFLFCAMALVWPLGCSIAAGKAGEFLLPPRVRRGVEAFAGAVLIALGVRLAAESHGSREHAATARDSVRKTAYRNSDTFPPHR